ncbi:hypothetical protein BOO36_16150 [Vibrio navarrensis]|uniref:hypothetical protein n=1 Tax=Vibrio navarrensis TaxID=29495 RepID=UPI001869A7BE|nr:hypothetical protein [Vibrio navarrensis]MBE4575340.1 hypothetical protein [Vibrio navarrensis]
MISQAALDELAGFAARGQLGYGIELQCNDLHPEADSVVTLEWDFTATGCLHGVLEISDAGNFQVQPIGQRRVIVGYTPIRVCLMVDGEEIDSIINPRIVAPYVRLHAPAQITLGESVQLVWQSNAETCMLCVIDGEFVQELDVGSAGEIEIQAQCLGDLYIELKALGRHAAFSPAGIARQETNIRVLPPPVQLLLDASEKTGFVGDEVTFKWHVSAAKRVRIIAIDRGISYEAPMQGQFVVEVGWESECFQIVATGLGGDKEVVRELRVNPRLFDLDDMQEELNELINLKWE